MLFIGVLKEGDGVNALIKLLGQEARARYGSEGTSYVLRSCLHGSCTAVSPFNYVFQNSVVVSFKKKKTWRKEESCVSVDIR